MAFKNRKQQAAVMMKLRLQHPNLVINIIKKDIELSRSLIPGARTGVGTYGTEKQLRADIVKKEKVLKVIKKPLTKRQAVTVFDSFHTQGAGAEILLTPKAIKARSDRRRLSKFLQK